MSNIVSLNESLALSQPRAEKNKVANELLITSFIGSLTEGLTTMTDILERSSETFLVDVNQIKKEEEIGKLFESLKAKFIALANKFAGSENGDDDHFSMKAIFEMGSILNP